MSNIYIPYSCIIRYSFLSL